MIPTYVGGLLLLLAVYLLRANRIELPVAWWLGLGLVEASAAVLLPVLGGSSIQPARIMLLVLLIQAFAITNKRATVGGGAFRSNFWLIVFCVYGVLSAFILTRIFAGSIDVAPMNLDRSYGMFDTVPLAPTSQNVTTAFYLIGTAFAAWGASVIAQTRDLTRTLVIAAVAIGLIHAATGFLGVVLKGTFWDDLVNMIRIGSYAQLEQRTDSFIRMSGLMPEPSSYARFAVVWFIFNFELWLRDERPSATGLTSLALGLALLFSTSTTAYVSLAIYALLVTARAATFPPYLTTSKLVWLLFLALGSVVFVAGFAIFDPKAAKVFADMVDAMTFQKVASDSGRERAFWAAQGITAFVHSHGLGIGAGSFRSSGLIQAIAGSLGVAGLVTFAAYSIRVVFAARQPQSLTKASSAHLASAAGWTAIAGLIPPILIAPSPDPGLEFAIFAGIALALRRMAPEAPAPQLPSQLPPGPESPPEGSWRQHPR